MKNDRLTPLLAQRPWLLADGAMGSNLFARGLTSGEAPELWNTGHPQRIRELQRSFIEAGADIILSNSFGGNRHRLKLHKAEDRVAELNEAAASLARAEADRASRVVLVGGSMGPTGEILEPLGPLSAADARESFAEQAAALARGGADILWIETMSSAEETEAAIEGARRAGLPIVTTLSFDTNGRTMMGITPAELAGLSQKHHLAACGSNCGVGAAELVASIANLAAAADPSTILVAKANCGIPQYVDGAIRFNGTPQLMASTLASRSMPAPGSSVDAAGPRRTTCARCAKRSRRTFAGPSPRSRLSRHGSEPCRREPRRSCAARWIVRPVRRPARPNAGRRGGDRLHATPESLVFTGSRSGFAE